ncbi:MAG: SDR family oxidoreductase [bacterium]|nr:SDR family oxidoreductase [bacterium]
MTRPRMLVTGGSGYLGGWVSRLAAAGWDVTATYSSTAVAEPGIKWRQLDVRDPEAVAHRFAEVKPQVVVHTAALNPGQGNDFEAVNVAGTANVARAAADTRLIHISTDMVFDGQSGSYVEEDSPAPLNEYGRTKALAETAVTEAGGDSLIIRTSLIYGWRPTVARAAQWMIDALDRGDSVRLWSDEMRCPIWVETLATAIVELADTDVSGFLHVGGDQVMSRYDFGVALLRFHGVDPSSVVAVPSPTDQLRPLNCTLDSSQARTMLATPLLGVDAVLGGNR